MSRVVVVGAGVAGLAAACALGRLGHRVVVLEKRQTPARVAKGEVLQPGSLAVLRRWGVTGLLDRAGALRLSRLVARAADGQPRMVLDYDRLPTDQPWLLAHDYPVILQALTDALPPSVEVRRGVVVREPLREGTRVTGVRCADGDLPAALVVAADGVSSRLRDAAGLSAPRQDYPHRLAAFELHEADVTPDFSAYVTDGGLRLHYPLPGRRVRLYVQVTPDELRGRDQHDLHQWADGVLAGCPGLAPLAEPLHKALAQRQLLPVGRALASSLTVPGLALAGDTGHLVHPMAAQGMNSAIADAHELAEMLRQGGSLAPAVVDHALRRYDTARRADLAHIGRTSHNAARMITTRSWLGTRALVGTGGNDRIRHEVMHTMSGLGVRRLTPLDRLHQARLLPDPRAGRLPEWVRGAAPGVVR
ncbi:2-polyprenyl-6-methoxyphenol hydroxylase-like FAD-dependent oxidoreductase [Crossiella equi]|uniref:2-polyprenyl-6-methoxyphenol hydroxylase-like FAD-dependent oxidoreductase n=1 Tax=Crossiella equi TaxID=130796 RepID=A0ABS5ATC4_9PSEU|nr:NAD(P)/FAD-dependent oxidoreductase [Crossiella equi]MBP2479507.1 2-polyprenyl-6-methoxyphenol hydroxylase-like FAD-dependent oxidoreductase [Crossiella equi]